jgi:hypothetical protein
MNKIRTCADAPGQFFWKRKGGKGKGVIPDSENVETINKAQTTHERGSLRECVQDELARNGSIRLEPPPEHQGL